MAHKTPPPDWFTTAIREGMAQLYALSLEGNPAADMLTATAKVWANDLWALLEPSKPKPDVDRPRLDEAFRRLRLNARRWPTPRMLRDELPARPEPPRPRALPPGQDPEAVQRRILRGAAARAELYGEPFPPAKPGQVP